MPFVRIEKSRHGGLSSYTQPVVVMGAYLADGKAHKSRSVTFRMTRPLLDQLGWTLDDHGRIGVAVHEGTGADQGYIQLVQDEERGYRGSQGGSTNAEDRVNQGVSISVTIERFRHYVLNECPVPSHQVNFIIDGNALIVECPDWLRYNTQSAPPPVVEEPKLPLPRQSNKRDKPNSIDTEVDLADLSLHLNRRERRLLANKIAGKLR